MTNIRPHVMKLHDKHAYAEDKKVVVFESCSDCGNVLHLSINHSKIEVIGVLLIYWLKYFVELSYKIIVASHTINFE